MVDNVLNNGYGEKERREEIRMKAATYQEQTGASMTFYAAVCEEFHSMQACYEGLSLEEAVEKYKEIRKDPRLAYYGNAMGVEIHDESLEEYDGYAFPLVEGSVIEGGNLDYVKELAIHPLAREALERIREAFPEYTSVSTSYIRDQEIAEYAIRRADGKCDLCRNEAPFNKKDGTPYLEAHHVEWLARGGSDVIENVVALCPNCHRRIHVLDRKEDTVALKRRLRSYYMALAKTE